MKSLLLSACIVLVTIHSFAQQWRLKSIIYEKGKDTLQLIANQQFDYSGNRGSDYKNGIIDYDSSYLYDYNYPPGTRYLQKFDANDRQVYYKSDRRIKNSIDHFEINTTSTAYDTAGRVILSSKTHENSTTNLTVLTREYGYDSLGKPSYITEYSGTNIMLRQLFYYDTVGNLTMNVWQDYNPATQQYTDRCRKTYEYDTADILIAEEMMCKLPTIDSYARDSRFEYTYDDNKRLIEILKYHYQSNPSDPSQKQVNVYSQGRIKIDSIKNYSYNTSTQSYLFYGLSTFKYNAQGDTLNSTYYLYDANTSQLFPNRKINILYNFHHQPDTVFDYFYETASTQLAWQIKQTHIYQIYWPASTEVTNKADVSLVLYPNPSSDIITIRADVKEGGDFSVAIYNMNGNVIKRWTEKSTSSAYLKSIPIIDLPSGNYILKIDGKAAQGVSRFTVTK